MQFSGSVEFSFKIDKHHFKQHFYLTSLSPQSKFVGILGFDFIQKFNIILHPKEQFCMYNQNKIMLTSHAQNETSDSNVPEENLNQIKPANQNYDNIPLISKTSLTNNLYPQINVMMLN